MAQPGQGLSLSARGESEFALMQQREHEAMYKKAIEKTLDTFGKRPDSAQAPPKEKNEARSRVQAIRHRLPMVAARDPVMGRRGGACTFTGTVASSSLRAPLSARAADERGASAMFRDGRQLAEMGMGYEAARRFLDGLNRDPTSSRLNNAFNDMMRYGKCHERNAFGKPCPKPTVCPGLGGRGHDWRTCPNCGGMWTNDLKALKHVRRRRAVSDLCLDDEQVTQKEVASGWPMHSARAVVI